MLPTFPSACFLPEPTVKGIISVQPSPKSFPHQHRQYLAVITQSITPTAFAQRSEATSWLV